MTKFSGWPRLRRAAMCAGLSMGAAAAIGTPAGTVIRNVATYQDQQGEVRASAADVTVTAVCSAQVLPGALSPGSLGTPAEASWTLIQSGNATAAVDVSLFASVGWQDLTLILPAGTRLVGQPPSPTELIVPAGPLRLELAADERLEVRVRGRITEPTEQQMRLQAGCDGRNSEQIVRGTPRVEPLRLTKALLGPDVGEPGQLLTFRLEVVNPNAAAVEGAVLSDVLPPGLEFVSAAPAPTGPDPDSTVNSTVTWPLGVLGPAERRVIDLVARVVELPDGATLINRAQLEWNGARQESVAPAFWVYASRLLVVKEVQGPGVVTPGDLLVYEVRVTNPSQLPMRAVSLTDQRGPGTRLEGAQATLRRGNQESALTLRVTGERDFVTGEFDLASGESVTVRYTLRVELDPPAQLDNRVVVRGLTVLGAREVEVRARSARAVKVRQPGAGQSDLAGRVYVDENRDGRYQFGLDRPVQGARVLLAGGLEVRTDDQGRYSLLGLRGSSVVVAVDPAGLPGTAQAGPLGPSGAARVDLRGGVAVQDFPVLGWPWSAQLRLLVPAESPVAQVAPTGEVRAYPGACAELRAGPGEPWTEVGPAWQRVSWNAWARPTEARACGAQP